MCGTAGPAVVAGGVPVEPEPQSEREEKGSGAELEGCSTNVSGRGEEPQRGEYSREGTSYRHLCLHLVREPHAEWAVLECPGH